MYLVVLLFSPAIQAQNPNVVYILVDQWRSTAFGYDGNKEVKTPAIDQLASESINFRNAITVAPVCTPYRAALMTGRFPTTTGMFLNDLYLPEEELCMAEMYKAAGYSTAYFGKWHLDGHGRLNNVEPERRQGFDYWKALECSHDYNNMPYYDNEQPDIKYWPIYSPFAIAQEASKYLETHSTGEKPFLLFISIATPHFPHNSAPQEYKQMYSDKNLTLRQNVPDDMRENALKELQGYYAHCTATDKAIGDILAKLRELDLYDKSIIVFTSDHGEMMGSHAVRPMQKQVAWDESIRVPFLIRYPAIDKDQGKVVRTPINTPDILPTLLSLSNMQIPDMIEGEDLSSIVQNPEQQGDRAALFMNVCPFTVMYPEKEYRGIRTSQYTYVKSPDRAFMLFDNQADPFQQHNLVGLQEAAAIQQSLDEQLSEKLKSIGDDDFKPRQYYLDKWGYTLGDRNTIPYTTEAGAINQVQTPVRK
jgi:arylsulfatase A-like enzyme